MNYSPAVLDRVRDPKFAGALPKDAPDVGTGEAGTLDEGTMARIQLRVDPRRRTFADAWFKVFGCSAAIASASLVTEQLAGRLARRVRGRWSRCWSRQSWNCRSSARMSRRSR